MDEGISVEITPTDELFRLKSSIVVDGKLSKKHKQISLHLLEILEENPECAKTLIDWKFPENELLYLFRSSSFPSALSIAALLISTSDIPPIFLSKSFLYFITTKLSKVAELNGGRGSYGVKSGPILSFATELILKDRECVRALYEAGFFILAAAIITPESSALYASVYSSSNGEWVDGETKMIPKSIRMKSITSLRTTPDTVYEIYRKQFDPEVIFFENNILELRTIEVHYKKPILDQIYSECYNMVHLIEIDTKGMLDMMLYNKMTYITEAVILLIMEKNSKAIKYYRRALEMGTLPDPSLIVSLLHMLESKETVYDAAIALYYFKDVLYGHRGFTEGRIRSIFQCLEFKCLPECTIGNEPPFQDAPQPSLSNSAISNLCASSHSPSDSSENVALLCSRSKLVSLLKKLYEFVSQEYFFYPSYVILMRCNLIHCLSERPFIKQYLEDFLKHVVLSSVNTAAVLFPSSIRKRQREEKYVEFKLDEACTEDSKKNEEENMHNSDNITKRRVIESEDED